MFFGQKLNLKKATKVCRTVAGVEVVPRHCNGFVDLFNLNSTKSDYERRRSNSLLTKVTKQLF